MTTIANSILYTCMSPTVRHDNKIMYVGQQDGTFHNVYDWTVKSDKMTKLIHNFNILHCMCCSDIQTATTIIIIDNTIITRILL